ncbi:MAG: thioredoxin-dependent thiol peroxidase [Rhodospirillaceae bacterium]|nr:thioredoxin-dependent thiol peroxidase [Rhodospirillaceae bacterium]
MPIKIGNKAPNFNLPVNGGQTASLNSLTGKNVIVYFYPKDDTPGCTKEACGFRDAMPDFKKANTVVIGISKDTIEKHEKFISKYDLNFSLASDENNSMCDDYEVWKEKNMYGRKYMGIERSTFLVDGKGILRAEWRKVKVSGHVDEVLAAVQAL